jgi:hypothetical protein
MQFQFRKREPSQIEFTLIYGGLAILLLAAARVIPIADMAPNCVFKSLTGVPCPTCGSTRSVAFLAHGHLLAAFCMNPVTAAVVIAVLAAFLYRLITVVFDLPGMNIDLSNLEKNLVRVIAVLVLLLNWIYLIFALKPNY